MQDTLRAYRPLIINYLALGIAICVELALILALNNGLFVYTLDNPYIHLVLGQNLHHSHYRINLAAICGSVLLFYTIFCTTYTLSDQKSRTKFITIMLVLITCTSGTVGIIFTGMEQSFQPIATLLLFYGIVIEIQIVRYETLALAGRTIIYLLDYKHVKSALSAALVLAVRIGSFSLYLKALIARFVPTSGSTKSRLRNGLATYIVQMVFIGLLKSKSIQTMWRRILDFSRPRELYKKPQQVV